MRISDWSSDVCSSDLQSPSSRLWRGRYCPPRRSSQIVGLHRKDRFVRLIGRHLVEQLVDPGVDDQDSGVRGTDETGRDQAPVENDQVVVEARPVEQQPRLAMIAELRHVDSPPTDVQGPHAPGSGYDADQKVRDNLDP